MVDIHSHVLPEMDDGSKSLDESIRMLEIAAAAGTTDIVGSPHANAEYAFRPELIGQKIAALREAMQDRIRVHSGCDFHLSYDNIQDALSHPAKYTINNHNYLLVEFSDASIFHRTIDIFGKLLSAGMIPIITHPERNALLQRRFSDLQQWVEDGCMVQVTGQSFLGVFGRSAKQYADVLLEKNLVHFVASDAHDCQHRPPRLDDAYAYVARKINRETADRIFIEYPGQVVLGEPIDPAPRLKRKWFQLWS